MSLFRGNDFAPMFRLMDDYANHVLSSPRDSSLPQIAKGLSKFQPKFDVKEYNDSYELHGELPGINQDNIIIEFTEPQTLTIKGSTETVREEGQRPSAALEDKPEQNRIVEKESSHHATVEDEDVPSTVVETPSTETADQQEPEPAPATPRSRYWVRELNRGSFSRVFSFPSRVDQDNVKASLKDGILSVVVPKAAAPQHRRINID